MRNFEAWQSKGHAHFFDSKVYFHSYSLGRVYDNFTEIRLLNKYLPKSDNATLVEIGCAGGELYRYFKRYYPKVDYTGCDVSKAAIELAEAKYPSGKFIATDPDLSQLKGLRFDYLFSRDVVLHQDDPFGFLKIVCSVPTKAAILRLRTRDVGKTELDIEKSCQYYMGSWVPFIIINSDELIAFLKSLKRCSRIVMAKDYMPLGGLNYRYLPKECYLESTGTAETAIYIEFRDDSREPAVEISSVKEHYSIPVVDRVVYKAIKHLLRPGPKSRVWW